MVTNNTYNERVPVIQVVPITAWSDKKVKIKTNVEIEPSEANGLTKKSIADCLQTRPIDYRSRFVAIRGELEPELMLKIDESFLESCLLCKKDDLFNKRRDRKSDRTWLTPDLLRLLDDRIVSISSRIPALERSTQEIKADWNLLWMKHPFCPIQNR